MRGASLVLLLAACASGATVSRSRSPEVPRAESSEDPVVLGESAPVVDACAAAETLSNRSAGDVAQRIVAQPSSAEGRETTLAWRALTDAVRRCASAGRGAWVLVPVDGTAAAVSGENMSGEVVDTHRLSTALLVTYVDGAGEAHRAATPIEVSSVPLDSESVEVSVLDVTDYDGDGVGELLLRTASNGWESGRVSYSVLTFRDGAVVPYAPLAGIDLAELSDYDGDGRRDVVSVREFWPAGECGADPPPAGAPPVLFHARDDGTFSASDEVALRFLREQCPPGATGRLLASIDDDCSGSLTLQRIACARLWGETADAVMARVQAELRGMTAAERAELPLEVAELTAHASIAPPAILR